jgi:two-component system cell cycle response regulator DivK
VILVVDDERDNREAYAEYLRFHGYRTVEAATGEQALLEAARCHPDVVLLDMRLPDLEGTDVTRRLRQLKTPKPRPIIIALSACVFATDVNAAIESGCDSFLAKPCVPDDVIAEIRRLLPRAAAPGRPV